MSGASRRDNAAKRGRFVARPRHAGHALSRDAAPQRLEQFLEMAWLQIQWDADHLKEKERDRVSRPVATFIYDLSRRRKVWRARDIISRTFWI
jgi:hypothetical protein